MVSPARLGMPAPGSSASRNSLRSDNPARDSARSSTPDRASTRSELAERLSTPADDRESAPHHRDAAALQRIHHLLVWEGASKHSGDASLRDDRAHDATLQDVAHHATLLQTTILGTHPCFERAP